MRRSGRDENDAGKHKHAGPENVEIDPALAQELDAEPVVHDQCNRTRDGQCGKRVHGDRRECDRYGMDLAATLRTQEGQGSAEPSANRRSWSDYLILVTALGVFVWFARLAQIPRFGLRIPFAATLTAILVAVLGACGWLLWSRTRFE